MYIICTWVGKDTSQMAHEARAYPGFCSVNWLGIFLLPPGWDASPSQGYPSIKFTSTVLYTWVERGTVRVKCLAHEHNTMSPARAWTQTAQSGVKHTNHEATASPTCTCYVHNFTIKSLPVLTMEQSFVDPQMHVVQLRDLCTDGSGHQKFNNCQSKWCYIYFNAISS